MQHNLTGVSFKISQDWIRTYSFVNSLLYENIPVLRNRDSFYILFKPSLCMGVGHVLSQEEIDKIYIYSEKENISLQPICNLTEDELLVLKPLRIALYGGGGSPYNYGYGLSEMGFDVYYIDDTDVRGGILKYFDVFVMPGGGAKAMWGQLFPLGEEGVKEIVKFVRQGGMYIGSCAGSYDASITPEVFTDSCPVQAKLQMVNAKVWNDGKNTEWVGLQSPGIGVIKVKNQIPEHPILWNVPEEFEISHYNGPIFEVVANSCIEGASQAIGLLKWSGITDNFTPSEEFLNDLPKAELTVSQSAVQEGKFASVVGLLDKGAVVLFGSHPEFGFSLAMDDIQEPFKLIANAILWQSDRIDGRSKNDGFIEEYLQKYKGTVLYQESEINNVINNVLDEVKESIEKLINKEGSPKWLSKDYSMSFFGKEPEFIWDNTLKECEKIADDIKEIYKENFTLMKDCIEKYKDDNDTRLLCKELYGSILYKRVDIWEQDFGYQGALKFLSMCKAGFLKAYESYEIKLERTRNPYAYLFENPFHLAVGSYLSSAGMLICVKLLAKMYRAKLKKYLTRKEINKLLM